MGYIRSFLVICLGLLLTGCSTLGKKEETFQDGYRAGVRQNLGDFAQAFYGNDFPYFYWESPIVQTVKIPAHIESGVFIPEHNEPVVIEPAQWRDKLTYPISRPKNEEEEKQRQKGEPYAFSYLDFNVRDITVLPEPFICAGSGGKDKDTH